jgi:hypothetical protein
MRARPAGPAQSSALHEFARSGPTKEAHRRAIYSSGGLLAKALAALHRLQKLPHLVRSFFRDPNLGYITA